jgi:prolyl-tRNA synthetase
MAKWIQSYRDLPLLLNQWANVVRWELRPRLFLRTSEFLWQEGHTAHATYEDARAYAERIHRDVYADFMTEVLAMPVVMGRKTTKERFAGAINTLTCEAMMGDGKALQMGTSHELGQNFAKAFDIQYLDASGAQQFAWTTSWGLSTRMVGGLIMGHGDDAGLRLPPELAPIQVVVVAVRDDPEVVERCAALHRELLEAGVRARLDDRVDLSVGRRATDWELKGVPLRLELGPRDFAEGAVTLVDRLEREKASVALAGAVRQVADRLAEMQSTMRSSYAASQEARTVDVATLEEAREASQTGWARVPWSVVGAEGEAELATSAVTVRCLVRPDGGIPEAEDEPDLLAITARAY